MDIRAHVEPRLSRPCAKVPEVASSRHVEPSPHASTDNSCKARPKVNIVHASGAPLRIIFIRTLVEHIPESLVKRHDCTHWKHHEACSDLHAHLDHHYRAVRLFMRYVSKYE